ANAHRPGPRLFEEIRPVSRMPDPVAFRNQCLNVLPQQLLSSIAEQPLELGVDEGDFPFVVHYHHRVWGSVHQTAELKFRTLALRNVAFVCRVAKGLPSLSRCNTQWLTTVICVPSLRRWVSSPCQWPSQ